MRLVRLLGLPLAALIFLAAPLSPQRTRTTARSVGLCYSLRESILAPNAPGSDRTRVVGYQGCRPANDVHLKTVAPQPPR